MQSMEEGMKRMKIPIGLDDFKEVRENGYYFVDKSELISDIIESGYKVYLFTRPRRFGKSLNLSMLDAFFNLKYKGNSWFDGLKINGHLEAEKYRNMHPVICLNMKNLTMNTKKDFIDRFKTRMASVYRGFSYLKNSESVDRGLREDYLDTKVKNFGESELENSLLALCEMLEQHHGVKPIIPIDEYDHPINSSFGDGSYGEILKFLRNFYSQSFKSNEHMSFAALTGVMQVAKEGIFSGLNNLKVDNIFDVKFDERYGFTEPEVKELCSYYGHPEKFGEAKEWYDGYKFGNADIYNPWSILNYIDSDFIPKKYWAGTSGNDIIDTLLENADEETFRELTALGNGEAVLKILTPTVAMNDLENEHDAVFSVLAAAGYLNAALAEEDSYSLSIPNREMYSVFYDHIRRFTFRRGDDLYARFLNALETGDTEKIQAVLSDILSKNYPFLLLKDEGDYHLILATIVLGREGRYRVSIDRESGNGRPDILMESRHPKYPNIVVEIKKAQSDSATELERLAHEALEQIKEKDYCRGLKGKALLYGISFKGKEAKALLEETSL